MKIYQQTRRRLFFVLAIFMLGLVLLPKLGIQKAHAYILAGDADAQAAPTPTPDRLAEPTLPPQPSQADLGAQDYWLHCLPCHGDRGQGLTDEFRLLYPETEQNCWESGCHGSRPYDNGFRLPQTVPVVVGDQRLVRFGSADGLFTFIRSAMPFQDPGSLEDKNYYQVTAFLIRENDLAEINAPIDSGNAERLVFSDKTGQNLPTATSIRQLPLVSTPAVTLESHGNARERVENIIVLYVLFGILIVVILALGANAAFRN